MTPPATTRPSARVPSVRISTPTLRRTLTKFESRVKAIGFSNSLVWGVIAGLGTMVLWVWVDVILDLPPLLRLLAWLAAFGVFVTLSGTLIRRTLQSASHDRIASRLDELSGSGGEIRSGLDLCDWANGRRGIDSITEGLAELAVRRASQSASRVSEGTAFPATLLIRSTCSLAATFFAVVMFVFIMPRMAKTELIRFVLPFGDQPAWSPYEFVVTPEDTEVIYGESLELSAKVNGPGVDQLELVLIPPIELRSEAADLVEPIDVLPMFPDHEGIWHASIANITEPFDYFFRVRKARSRPFKVGVITVPEIREVEVKVTPPLYTGQSPYRGVVPVDGIAGLPATQVTFTVVSNRPLSAGTLAFVGDEKNEVYQLEPEGDPRRVTGMFSLEASGRVELKITDELGQDSIEEYTIPIRLLEDQHPIVRMIQPQPVSLATPNVTLPVIISVEDDYGIRKCELYRSLNDSRFLPMNLELPIGVPRRVELQTGLPLATYGLEPGDVIKLFARVEDNDPNGIEPGIGKGTETPIVTVMIISEDELNRMQEQRAGMDLLMNKYAQAQRRFENIAEQMQQLMDELRELPADSPLAKEIRDQLAQLGEQMLKEAEMMRKLADQKLPFEIDEKLSPELKEMGETLQKMAEQLQQAAADEETTHEQLQQLIKQQQDQLQNEQARHDEERMQPLEQLKQVMPLRQDEQMFTQLVQKQKQLAERLSSLRDFEGGDDPAKKARMRELEDQQRDVRNQLADLLEKIDEDAERLGDDEQLNELKQSAREFVRAVRSSGALEQMVDAEDGLGQFSGQRGHEGAKQAAESLEKFLSQAGQMGQQAGHALSGFAPGGLGQSLENTLQQLTQGTGQNSGQRPGQVGMGTEGRGGQSSQSNSLDNVGMYGGNPLLEPSESRYGQSDQNSRTATRDGALAGEDGNSGRGFQTSQSATMFGGADWGVPLRYQRQAGRYLQRLAEELEEQ